MIGCEIYRKPAKNRWFREINNVWGNGFDYQNVNTYMNITFFKIFKVENYLFQPEVFRPSYKAFHYFKLEFFCI